MAEARTLLQMAGAPLDPARLSRAALVVIDAQGEYQDGDLPLDGIESALACIEDLLARARDAGATIVHVAHRGALGRMFDRQAPRGEFLRQSAPKTGEAVVEKSLPNAFAGTDLHARLSAAGSKELILAGFMTHMCVSSTARAALDLGYRVTIASDACATRALPDPMGGAALPAAQVHATALAELADRFAIVVPSSQIRA